MSKYFTFFSTYILTGKEKGEGGGVRKGEVRKGHKEAESLSST